MKVAAIELRKYDVFWHHKRKFMAETLQFIPSHGGDDEIWVTAIEAGSRELKTFVFEAGHMFTLVSTVGQGGVGRKSREVNSRLKTKSNFNRRRVKEGSRRRDLKYDDDDGYGFDSNNGNWHD